MVLLPLFGNLSLDLFMHPSSNLCIYLARYLPMELHTPCRLLLLETSALDVAFGCFGGYPSIRISNYLFTYLSVCLSIYLSIDRSIYLSIHPSIHLSTYLSPCLSIYRSIDLSIYRSICLSTYLSVCLSIYLSIDLSIYLPTYLSTSLSLYLSIYQSISLYPSIDLSKLYLSASPLSVCLSILSYSIIFYLFFLLTTLHLSVNLIYFSTLHLSINLLTSPRLSLCPYIRPV